MILDKIENEIIAKLKPLKLFKGFQIEPYPIEFKNSLLPRQKAAYSSSITALTTQNLRHSMLLHRMKHLNMLFFWACDI